MNPVDAYFSKTGPYFRVRRRDGGWRVGIRSWWNEGGWVYPAVFPSFGEALAFAVRASRS
jgi:hypothetical protein